MKTVFSDQTWEDYRYWVNTNDKVRDRNNELIKQSKRNPFKGTGKPEPLKGDLTGWWSRRLSKCGTSQMFDSMQAGWLNLRSIRVKQF